MLRVVLLITRRMEKLDSSHKKLKGGLKNVSITYVNKCYENARTALDVVLQITDLSVPTGQSGTSRLVFGVLG